MAVSAWWKIVSLYSSYSEWISPWAMRLESSRDRVNRMTATITAAFRMVISRKRPSRSSSLPAQLRIHARMRFMFSSSLPCEKWQGFYQYSGFPHGLQGRIMADGRSACRGCAAENFPAVKVFPLLRGMK